jgi:hypothetical protein
MNPDEHSTGHAQQAGDPQAQSSDSNSEHQWSDQATHAWQDAVTTGVRMAYQVINEQIRLGQKVARQVNPWLYDMGNLRSDTDQIQDLWFRPWAELTSRWFEMAGHMMGAAWPGGPGGPGGTNGYAGHSAPANAPTSTRVIVQSQRPTEVALDLPTGVGSGLAIDPLRPDSGEGPALIVTGFENAGIGAPLTIGITVSEDQPTGAYSGAIRAHDTGHEVGSLKVSIQSAD